jgi:hypothetical protein
VLHITDPKQFIESTGEIVSTEKLGFGFQAEMPYEKPDGTPFNFDSDFFRRHRGNKPTPGPFQVESVETIEIDF